MSRNLFVFLYYFLLTAMFCGSANAQSETRYFSSISVDKGLSQSTVYTIAQDTLGFMWMGTQDGLNRFDGKTFTAYRSDKNDAGSLQSYYIRTLFIDGRGQLWIGGNKGVSLYNYTTGRFINYRFAAKPGEWFISSITEDETKQIWASTSAGEIFKLDGSTDNFLPVKFTSPQDQVMEIYSLLFHNKKLYVGTQSGLSLLNLSSKIMSKVNSGIGNVWVNSLFADPPYIWIATEGEGLVKLNTESGQFVNYRHQSIAANNLADNDVRSVCKDASGNLWIGTFKGLSILNPQTEQFYNYYHQAANPYTISQNSVRCIYRDKQNGMWLGTFYGGVNYYHKDEIKFNSLNQNSGDPRLNDNVINVIKQDSKGNFWIGTNDKGLNYWQPALQRIKYYTSDENGADRLSSNNIKAIAFGDKGEVYLGTHNAGLNVLNPATGQIKIYRHSETNAKTISGNMVYALLKDNAGRIWAGTRAGLNRYNPADGSFTKIQLNKAGKRVSSDDITFLMEDSRNRIWVGTTNGVIIFYADDMLFEPIASVTLSSDLINFIAEDKKKRIWIGTRNGLNLYDENAKSFINTSHRDDFLKGTINSILTDDEDNLWIATNTNLVKFNPDTRKSQYFDVKDGLQNNQFNTYAACKAADGMYLFGGINGVSYFYPHTLRQQPQKLDIAFTALEMFNQTITPDDGTGILKQHIDRANTLYFTHEHKQFTISFNTFNYVSANRTKYLYKLGGFDKDWQQTDNIPKATYTNLQSGRYTFHVKAIGPQGETSPERILKIVISPVWYRSNWFYLLVLIAICVTAFFLYRIITDRIRTLHQLKLERLQREKVNYINQVKMDFFTNISHELRTPLTLILAPLEEMMSKPVTGKQMRKHHELMLLNVKRLYNLVNHLFEFKKTEMSTRKLRVTQVDMVGFVNDIYISFKPLSEKNNIRYSYSATEPALSFYFDKDAIENILFNLLSNAFKYTASGEIRIVLSKNEETAVIKIIDTGKGIEAEHLNRIFDRFYQVSGEEMNLGSGVGLAFTRRLVELHHGTIGVESSSGKGSTFTVQIPMSAGSYTGDIHTNIIADKKPSVFKEANDSVQELMEEKPDEIITEENIQKPEVEKLLIVDDNREIVDYLKDYFGKSYHINVAFDGKEALALLEDYHPDLIISDVMMPEMDGLHFCKRIKQNIQSCHIPVVLLTAKTESEQELQGLQMGADDYVTKPFSPILLEARVQNILRSRRRLREYYANSKEVIPEKITFNSLDEEFLRKAISIVEANIQEYDFSVDKFARETGMSRSNLYLKIKAITGESVTAFIKRIRFKKAAELMESRYYTIAEVAYMCGFNSPSYFSTAFKQYYNCMPTEYLAKKESGENGIVLKDDET